DEGRHPHRRRRDRPDAGRAHAGRADGPAHRAEPRARPARPAGRHADPAAAGLRRLPVAAAHRHAVPAGPERLLHAAGAHRRLRGQGDRGLRPHRHRRLAGRRPGDLRDPHRGAVRRHHQRRRARGRGRRPLHPRRHARQADGHRRRPQRRPDRRGPGAQAPLRGHRRGRLLRLDGRCLEVRQGRRDRRHHRDAGEPHRRVRHRRHAARHGPGRGGLDLLAADRRRRPGLDDPGAADVHRDRHHRHPLGQRWRHGRRPDRPARPVQAARPDRRRRLARPVPDPRTPQAAVPARGRALPLHGHPADRGAGGRRGGRRRGRRRRLRAAAGLARGDRREDAGGPTGARGGLRPGGAGRHHPRRRPAGPRQGAAPQGRHGDRPGHPAGAHPRQPRPAGLPV
ncbi:MAG: Flagellar biosynthesis protein FlhA, partial [uncultured Nocardioidaceae bacterium]